MTQTRFKPHKVKEGRDSWYLSVGSSLRITTFTLSHFELWLKNIYIIAICPSVQKILCCTKYLLRGKNGLHATLVVPNMTCTHMQINTLWGAGRPGWITDQAWNSHLEYSWAVSWEQPAKVNTFLLYALCLKLSSLLCLSFFLQDEQKRSHQSPLLKTMRHILPPTNVELSVCRHNYVDL